MTPEYKRALAKTLKVEGGFVDHPNDRGGPTNKGVTMKTLEKWIKLKFNRPATIEDLKAITHEVAEQLYADLYWSDRALPCQKIAEWWEPLAHECFDSAVLHGPDQAAKFLQRALNLLNMDVLGSRVFDDLEVDGFVGDVTLKVLPLVDKLNGGRAALFRAVNIEQAVMLNALATKDKTQEANYRGWILKRVQMEAA